MTKRKTKPVSTPAFASAEPVVFHQADMPLAADVPARHLNAADLEYVARVRALQASGGQPVPQATEDEIAALADELVASGAFSRTPPPEPPADPAEEKQS